MRAIITIVLSLLAFMSVSVSAVTISDLQKQHKLTISTSVSTTDPVAIGEQVILSIDIATDRWFSRGTRIGIIQIPNAIVLQRNKLATNYISKQAGTTWSHQIWELVIYPQKSGDFVIPRIPIEVTISESSTNNVSGTILSSPAKFNAMLPSGRITKTTPWIAARELEFAQSFSVTAGQILEVGDAIERQITMQAKDTSAMLFPQLSYSAIPGLKAYQAPVINVDESERGLYSAKRTLSTSYIVLSSGAINIPELTLYWWDIDTKQLKEITLPSLKVTSKHTLTSWIKAYSIELLVGIFLSLILIMLRKPAYRLCLAIVATDRVQFVLALLHKDWAKTNVLTYKKLYQNKNSVSFTESFKNEQDIAQWSDSYKASPQKKSLSVALRLWILTRKSNK